MLISSLNLFFWSVINGPYQELVQKACVEEYFHIRICADKIYIFFTCAAVYMSLQLLGSELTERRAQIVMVLYILIAVIVMSHKTGGEKYSYQCHHSHVVLVSKIPASSDFSLFSYYSNYNNIPTRQTHPTNVSVITEHKRIKIKEYFIGRKHHMLQLHKEYILCSFRVTSWCWCEGFHCWGTGRPKGRLAVDSSPQYHIWCRREVALWRNHPQQWVGADCCTLLGHVSACFWKKKNIYK